MNHSNAEEQRPSSQNCTIAATATALPPHTITRDDVKYYMGRVFDIPERKLEAMMSIVDNARVHNRHAIFPIEYTVEPRALSKTNEEYMEHAIKLGREAAEKCLQRAGLAPTDNETWPHSSGRRLLVSTPQIRSLRSDTSMSSSTTTTYLPA